jgi:hypothetical protein
LDLLSQMIVFLLKELHILKFEISSFKLSFFGCDRGLN